MSCRTTALNTLTLLAVLGWSGDARAHRLDAQVFVGPSGQVRVESWFETGDLPKGAKVEVFRVADGKLLFEGKIDTEGNFVFTYSETEPLRVVVYAGAGHRAEVLVKKAELEAAMKRPAAAVEAPPERATGPQSWKLILGVGLLLSVAGGAWLVRQVRRKSEPGA